MTGFTTRHLFPQCAPMLPAGGFLCLVLLTGYLPAQVMTIGPDSVNARFAKIEPTHVDLPSERLTGKTRQQLIRLLVAEQGFTVRPLPKGGHGLVLQANGALDPSGMDYLHMLEEKGTSVRAGDRVVVSDVKIGHDRIIFELNGGPDRKHKWLRHVQIGASPNATAPIVADTPVEPAGSRLTLVFKEAVPELTGAQVKSLIAPIIDFSFKTPVQAFTDTLPPLLKRAILNHEVLVGMNTEMVLYSIGKPDRKSREIEGQMPYEEWIYGEPPKDVQFVRINGDQVIRVELAKVGQEPVIRDKNEVEGLVQQPQRVHEVKLGDVRANPGEAPKAPPSLRLPGEKLPNDDAPGTMGPVQFPKDSGKQKPLPPPAEQFHPGSG